MFCGGHVSFNRDIMVQPVPVIQIFVVLIGGGVTQKQLVSFVKNPGGKLQGIGSDELFLLAGLCGKKNCPDILQ